MDKADKWMVAIVLALLALLAVMVFLLLGLGIQAAATDARAKEPEAESCVQIQWAGPKRCATAEEREWLQVCNGKVQRNRMGSYWCEGDWEDE